MARTQSFRSQHGLMGDQPQSEHAAQIRHRRDFGGEKRIAGAISVVVGRLPGGTQRTALVIRQDRRLSPSSGAAA